MMFAGRTVPRFSFSAPRFLALNSRANFRVSKLLARNINSEQYLCVYFETEVSCKRARAASNWLLYR